MLIFKLKMAVLCSFLYLIVKKRKKNTHWGYSLSGFKILNIYLSCRVLRLMQGGCVWVLLEKELQLLPILDNNERVLFFLPRTLAQPFPTHEMSQMSQRKNYHLRTKLTFSFHLVAIMGETMPAIISNESHWVPLGVTGCTNGLDCLFLYFHFFFFSSSRRVLRWCILYMMVNFPSHVASDAFFLSVMWTVSHRGWWALLEDFRIFDGLSLHLILNQKVCFTLISNARRYAIKGSLFFLLIKIFTVCFISTFYLKKKCNVIYQVYVFVKDICISFILCHLG